MVNGVLNIDKPKEATSHDVVNQVRRIFNQKRVGHAGTLDPFATGVLVVGLGNATRLLEYTRNLQKTYRAIFTLGATSDTDDVTGVISQYSSKQVTLAQAEEALRAFIGEIEQVPPAYSAVKLDGKKLYELARASTQDASEKALLRKRSVTVYDISVLNFTYPHIELEITCGSGTYIRSLARDLGEVLETGAYVEELTRTAIGPFTLDTATPITELSPEHLMPSATLVEHVPRADISPELAQDFRQGKRVPSSTLPQDGPVAVFCGGELLGIATTAEGELCPSKVLPAS